MSNLFSIWLSMNEPAKSYLSEVIKQLCGKYDAVSFEPHLTLISGNNFDYNDLKKQVDLFFEGFSPVVLTIKKVNYTEDFFKTLFLEFKSNEILYSMYKKAKSTFMNTHSKIFFPHISLLYKNIHIKEKEEIARSIDITLKQIHLNHLKIVTPKQNDTDWFDIKNWQILYEKSIT